MGPLRSLTTLLVALLACIPGAPAGAEQERVDDMGRTQGWVVAIEGGDLSFIDCQGRRSPLGSARIEPSIRNDRIVHAQDDTGRVRSFYITDDVSTLEQLKQGDRI